MFRLVHARPIEYKGQAKFLSETSPDVWRQDDAEAWRPVPRHPGWASRSRVSDHRHRGQRGATQLNRNGSSPDGHAERMRSPRTKERSRSGGDDDDLESGNDTKCRHTTNLNLLQTRFPNCRRFLSHTDCQNESDLSKFGFCLVKSYPETRVLSLSQTLTSGNNNEKPDVDVVIKF